jgi:hypothetical protein
MNEAWGAVVAAIAAGVFGIIGILAGIYVGRRQTTDQAAVEHQQWLRQQRLEAYTSLFTAWDQAISEFRAFQNTWDDTTAFFHEHGSPDGNTDIVTIVDQKTTQIWATLRPHVERTELLGPVPVQTATIGLRMAYTALRARLLEQAYRESEEIVWPVWEGELAKADVARSEFHAAASKVLRTQPSPQGELLL